MRKNIAHYFAAAMVSAAPLAAQDAAELFSKLDANKDGYITEGEVQESQKALYERMLRNADKDGDKKLSKEEFQTGLKPDDAPKPPLAGGQPFPGRPGDAKGDPREFFGRMDANKDGKLSKSELPERMQENFARMDANGDGSVSQEEFAQAGRQFGKRPPGAPGTPPAGGQPGGPANKEEFEALFDRTDSNSDGKLTKDEIPEERRGMRAILERAGGDSLNKEQFVRGMLAQAGGQPGRPEGAPPRRPDGPPAGSPVGPPPGALFAALDADRNGELSTTEIVAAGSALLKLDRNGDGKLTPDEVFAGGPGGGPPGRPGDGRPGVGRPGDGLPPATPPGERRPGQRGLFGVNPEEFQQRLKEADANSDGKISKDEAPPILRGAFERLDANSDGFVDEAEAREMFRRMADGAGKAIGRPDGDQPRRPDSNEKK